jgi:hypothetical protein
MKGKIRWRRATRATEQADGLADYFSTDEESDLEVGSDGSIVVRYNFQSAGVQLVSIGFDGTGGPIMDKRSGTKRLDRDIYVLAQPDTPANRSFPRDRQRDGCRLEHAA